jgi:hypothetical protein
MHSIRLQFKCKREFVADNEGYPSCKTELPNFPALAEFLAIVAQVLEPQDYNVCAAFDGQCCSFNYAARS